MMKRALIGPLKGPFPLVLWYLRKVTPKVRKRSHLQSDSQIKYSGIRELLDAENSLAIYNKSIVQKLHQGLQILDSKVDLQVVDFGAGTGTLATLWQTKFGIAPICVEIDPELRVILGSKGFSVFSKISELPDKVLSVYSSNVLEHINDDISALEEIRDKLQPSGRLAIYVPALPILFSDLDRKVGHFRRYKRRELITKVEAAGFIVEKCFFNDSLGVLATLALKFFGYGESAALGSRSSLLIYDKFIYPLSKKMDFLGLRFIIGKNLFLFASIPDCVDTNVSKQSQYEPGKSNCRQARSSGTTIDSCKISNK